MDLVCHAQTEKNMTPLSAVERSIKPYLIVFMPTHPAGPGCKLEVIVVDHKGPFNSTSSPKQIKCIDRTNKLVLGA